MNHVFRKDGRKYLDFSYVPPRLPHREREISILLEILKPILSGETETYSIPVLYGSTGTGKTTTAKKVLETLSEREAKINIHRIMINCSVNPKPFNVAQRISQMILETYIRGYGFEEIMEMIYDALELRDEYIILILDEIDEMLRYDRGRFLNILTRLEEPRGTRRIFPVLIARKYEHIADLPDYIRNKISGPLIHFYPYTVNQMKDIIMDRIKLSMNEGVITKNAIDAISYISAAIEGGDARTAISLLLNAGNLAERENANKIVVEHIRRVYEQRSAYLYRFLGKLDLKLLQLLICISKVMDKRKDEYVISGHVLNEIQVCFSNRFMQPVTISEIKVMIERLYEKKLLFKEKENYFLLTFSPASILSRTNM